MGSDIKLEDIKLVFHGQVLQDFVTTGGATGGGQPSFVADTDQTPTKINQIFSRSDNIDECRSVTDIPEGTSLSLIRIQRQPPCESFQSRANKQSSGKAEKGKESPHDVCATCHWSRGDHTTAKRKKACPLLAAGSFGGKICQVRQSGLYSSSERPTGSPQLQMTLPSRGLYTVWQYAKKEHTLSDFGLRSNSVVLLLRDAVPVRKSVYIHAESDGSAASFHCHPCTALNGLMREMRRRSQSVKESSEFQVVDTLEFTPDASAAAVVLASSKSASAPKCLCDFPAIQDGACLLFKAKLAKKRKAGRRRASSPPPKLPAILTAGDVIRDLRTGNHCARRAHKGRGSWADVLPAGVWAEITAAHEYVQRNRPATSPESLATTTTAARVNSRRPPCRQRLGKLTLEHIDRESRCYDVGEEESDDCCCICLDGYHTDGTVRELNCGHRFHRACIDAWLLSAPFGDGLPACCPFCKQTIGEGTMKDMSKAGKAREIQPGVVLPVIAGLAPEA